MLEKIIKILQSAMDSEGVITAYKFSAVATLIMGLIKKPNDYAQQGKTVDVYWFTNIKGAVGVVLTVNDRNEQRAYISTVTSADEDIDEKFIREWGNKLTVTQAIGFFGKMIRPERYCR